MSYKQALDRRNEAVLQQAVTKTAIDEPRKKLRDVVMPMESFGSFCPRCGKVGQRLIRFRGTRSYVYFKHYGKKGTSTHHTASVHSEHYAGPFRPKSNDEAMTVISWRTRRLRPWERAMLRKRLENA